MAKGESLGTCWTANCNRIGKCNDRCRAWFATFPDLIEGCKAVCELSNGKKPESDQDYIKNYLAGGNVTAQQYYALNYSDSKNDNSDSSSADSSIYIIIAVIVILLILFFFLM